MDVKSHNCAVIVPRQIAVGAVGVCCQKASEDEALVREKALLVAGHCDPTVNLYDWFVCARRGVVEALWPVGALGVLW